MYPVSELISDRSISNIAMWYQMYHDVVHSDHNGSQNNVTN